MKILVYGLNYSPEPTGIGKYTGEMASWLTNRGHEVRVVTAPPYYPAWRIREDYRGKLYRTERLPDQPVVYRTPLYVPERPTSLRRLAHLFSFMLGSVPVMLREMFREPQLVFTVEPTFFGVPLALFVAKTCGIPCWLHVQDFEVEAAFDLGLLPREGVVHDLALRIENFFTLAFDRVSSISTRMVQRLRANGVSPTQAIHFPNWVDVDIIHPQTSELKISNLILSELAQEVPAIAKKIVLLYSGNMGMKQGLELLPPLAEAFTSDPRVHFILCGNGAFRPQLERLVSGRKNVTMIPLQPLDRLNHLLNAADIHLLPQHVNAADLVMPSRLTGMLASGRPVIAMAAPGTQVAQVVQGRGLVVPAEDSKALYSAVACLVENEDLRLSLGRAAREYAVENLGKQQVLERFETDLEALFRSFNPG